jgi:hypothetical protein
MNHFMITRFVRGEGLSTAILPALSSLQEKHYGTRIETEEGLLARIVAESGTIQNRPRIPDRVRRSMFRSCGVSNEDDGRHFGKLL